MANITLHSDSQTSATSVSNIFIDEYMSDANGEFVKIYLYLLRQLNAPDAAFSISAMADKFEHTEKDIKRASKKILPGIRLRNIQKKQFPVWILSQGLRSQMVCAWCLKNRRRSDSHWSHIPGGADAYAPSNLKHA